VDGDAAGLSVDELALTGMQTGANLQIEVADPFPDCEGAADRPRRPVEGGEEAVACSVHLLARKRPSCERMIS